MRVSNMGHKSRLDQFVFQLFSVIDCCWSLSLPYLHLCEWSFSTRVFLRSQSFLCYLVVLLNYFYNNKNSVDFTTGNEIKLSMLSNCNGLTRMYVVTIWL